MRKFFGAADSATTMSEKIKNNIVALTKNSFVKAGLFGSGVALAGVMNTVEVKAQAIELPNYAKYIMIGRNDPNDNSSNNHILTFGKGGLLSSPDNAGMWWMGVQGNGINIGRTYNMLGTGLAGIRAFQIANNGTVGINVWTPHNIASNNIKLDVAGNIMANGTIYYSDSRYKNNIKPINNWDKLFNINSVQYNPSSNALKEKLELFKQENKDMPEQYLKSAVSDFERQIAEREADTRTHFGFIAQELREVYPNLVYEDGQGFLGVNYVELIPVLVEAIKELKIEIDAIKGKGFEKTNTTVISTAKLYQNNPNPFSENTEIQYYVPENANEAMICIYDLTGSQIIRFDLRDRGVISSLTVRGSQLKAGMYIYALLVDGKEVDTKRMILTDK